MRIAYKFLNLLYEPSSSSTFVCLWKFNAVDIINLHATRALIFTNNFCALFLNAVCDCRLRIAMFLAKTFLALFNQKFSIVYITLKYQR